MIFTFFFLFFLGFEFSDDQPIKQSVKNVQKTVRGMRIFARALAHYVAKHWTIVALLVFALPQIVFISDKYISIF